MKTEQEIRDLLAHYRDDYYTMLRAQQKEDLTYYRDTFKPKILEEIIRISRTGGGAELIDDPVAQLSAAMMSIIRDPLKDSQTAKDEALRISGMLNEVWIPKMMKRTPNPKFSFIKNLFLYGEAWLHPVHNESWVVKKNNKLLKIGLPVIFTVPEPLHIFASPNEDDDGIPEHTLVWYERLPRVVKAMYPSWSNPLAKSEKAKDLEKKTVKWMEYWDAENRYFEADGEAILKGSVQPNIYKFNPFVHKLSGWGTGALDALPEERIVGRLRNLRGLLERECAITSDVDSIFHMFANRSIDVQPMSDQHHVPKDFRDQYRIGSGFIHEIPYGLNISRSIEELPEPQYFEYLYGLKAELGRKTPGAFKGEALGGSGRQQDIAYATAMKLFEEQVRNTQYAFETAFAMSLQMCDNIPGLYPPCLEKDDLHKYYEVKVELKADDPVETDRLSSQGSRMWQAGEIDLITNLTQYQGKTPEEAKEIIEDILVERIMFHNPIIADLIGMKLAEKAGMMEEYNLMKQMKQGAEGAVGEPTATEMERGQGEIKTALGREMPDVSQQSVGARRRPTPYRRT